MALPTYGRQDVSGRVPRRELRDRELSPRRASRRAARMNATGVVSAAAVSAALLTHATMAGQATRPLFVAFRADANRVVAITVTEASTPQITEGLSPEPV